jgi:hypothetical protein
MSASAHRLAEDWPSCEATGLAGGVEGISEESTECAPATATHDMLRAKHSATTALRGMT